MLERWHPLGQGGSCGGDVVGAARHRSEGGFGGGWRGGRGWGSQEEKDFVGHRWRAKEMDVIAVGDEHAPLAKEGLDKAKDRVEPEGK
jgi:hypothetical protein